MGNATSSPLASRIDAPGGASLTRHPWLAALAIIAAGYAAITAITAIVGMLLTNALDDTVGAWDSDVTKFFARHRNEFLDAVTKRATSGVGSLVHLRHASLPVILVAVGVVAFLVWRGRWREGAFLVTALVLQVVMYRTVVHLVTRNRPPVFDLDDTPSNTSFPSGHTAAFTVLFVGIALVVMWSTRNRAARVTAIVVAILGVGVPGFGRVYRGSHSLLDVLAGIALGLGCLAVAALAVRIASPPPPSADAGT